MDNPTDQVKIQFPDEFSSLLVTKDVTKISAECYKATVTGVTNPIQLSATGLFKLWTVKNNDQLNDVNFHFGTVGFAPAIKQFTSTKAQFKVPANIITGQPDTTLITNTVQTLSNVEVIFKIQVPLRPHDQIMVTFPSAFDLTQFQTQQGCRSVFLGVGTIYQSSYSLWNQNKAVGVYGEDTSTDEQGDYVLDCLVEGQTIRVYGFMGEMDPRKSATNNEDDKWIALRFSNVKNPFAVSTGASLIFSLYTLRYTYDQGPVTFLERQTSIIFTHSVVQGSISDIKCDFSNSAKYQTYFSSQKVPQNILLFVDFQFTTQHSVQGGGVIKVQLSGLQRPQSSDSYRETNQWCYIIQGLRKQNSYPSCSWIDDSNILISNYDTTTSAPTIKFRTQVKVTGNKCFQQITSYSDVGATTIIDQKSGINLDTYIQTDSLKARWGGSTFALSFTSSAAGTMTTAHLSCTSGNSCDGTLQNNYATTKTSATDALHFIFNDEQDYHQLSAGQLITSNADQLSSSGYSNATQSQYSSGLIIISNLNNNNNNWINFYIASVSNSQHPEASSLQWRTPKYKAYQPDMHKYEICVAQYDPDDANYPRINCGFFDFTVPSDNNDGDDRCYPSCFSMIPGGNQHEATWDFMILKFSLPTKATDNDFDLYQFGWDVSYGDGVYIEISCTSATSYFTDDGYFGLSSEDAKNFPVDISQFGTRKNAFVSSVQMSVSLNTITLESKTQYQAGSNTQPNIYYLTFPVLTRNSVTKVSALSCSANFYQQDSSGFERQILTLSSESQGPYYILETNYNNRRDYYTENDKVYMNYKGPDLEFPNGGTGSFVVSQRSRYGNGQDSWCLVKIPKYFKWDTSTQVTTTNGGNLTFITSWEFADQSGNDHFFVLTYHGNEDVWPQWTNDFEVTGIKAPSGEQTSWRSIDDGFYTYMVCGNEETEGEAGKTYNSLMIAPFTIGFASGTLSTISVTERQITDFMITFTLDPDYAILQNSQIKIIWTYDFQPSYILIGTEICDGLIGVTQKACYPDRDYTGGSQLTIIFKDTLVVKTVPDGSSSVQSLYLVSLVDVYGTWDTSKLVYKCENLNQNTNNCGSISSSGFSITVNQNINRYVAMQKVRTVPNNKQQIGMTDWPYSDLNIQFKVSTVLPYNEYIYQTSYQPRIELTIPTDYVIQSPFDTEKNCFMNFKGDCSISGYTITIYPFETLQPTITYNVWLVQAVKNPTSNTAQISTFKGQTYFLTQTVDQQMPMSSDLSSAQYTQLKKTASSGTSTKASMIVSPPNSGEKALYTFTAENSLSTDFSGEVWIRFPSSLYDYYVGDAEIWFVNEVDYDEDFIYYLPCLVSSTDSQGTYHTGAKCTVKRQTVRVQLGQTISAGSQVTINLVDIYNPQTLTAQTFQILFMNSSSSDVYYGEQMELYYTISYTFKDKPNSWINLISVNVAEGDSNRALRGTDDYSFRFSINDNGNGISQNVFMTSLVSKFILYFPHDYSVHPTITAPFNSNYITKSCDMYQVSSMNDQTDDTSMFLTTKPTCIFNYTSNSLGNALEFSFESGVTFKTSEATNYYDYIFSVKNVSNPDDATKRTDQSIDFAFVDNTPTSYSDNLWIKYSKYTQKFNIGVFDGLGTAILSTTSYNSRSYGILNSAWLGFSPKLKMIYLADQDFMVISQQNPIQVCSGQQSEDYQVVTGETMIDSIQQPIQIAYVKISSNSDWVQFGLDNLKNSMTLGSFSLKFRVTATNEEAGSIKYISWNRLDQSEQKYANLVAAKVVVHDSSISGFEGQIILDSTSVDVLTNYTSIPIVVRVNPPPASELILELQVNIDPNSVNSAEIVQFSQNQLSYAPWQDENSFTVTLNNWNLDYGSTFDISFGLAGENAPAYKVGASDKITINIKTSSTLPVPQIIINTASLLPSRFGVSKVLFQSNGVGQIFWVIQPSGQSDPLTPQQIVEYSSQGRILFDADVNIDTTSDSDNSTNIEGNLQLSDYEQEALESEKEFLASGFVAGSLYSYSTAQQIELSVEKGLYAQNGYQIFATFRDLVGHYSSIGSVSFSTLEGFKSAPIGVQLGGTSKPQGDSLKLIKTALANSISYQDAMIKSSDSWVQQSTSSGNSTMRSLFTSERQLAANQFEAIFLLMPDNSGKITQDPQAIIQNSNPDNCQQCAYNFQQYLSQAGSPFSVEWFGETPLASQFSISMNQIPSLDFVQADEGSDSLTMKYSGTEEDLLFITVVIQNTTRGDLSDDQVIYGLDWDNQPAVTQFATTLTNNQTIAELTGLDSQQAYSVFAIAVNSRTSISDGVFSIISAQHLSTTQDNSNEEGSHGSSGLILQLLGFVLVLISV